MRLKKKPRYGDNMSEDDEKKDEDRSRRDPFGTFGRDIFGDMFGSSDMFGFTDIDKEFEKMQKLAEEMLKKNRARTGKDPFVYGFSVRTGPDGQPKVEEFGNAKDYFYSKDEDERSEWTPLTDVQETEDSILVTIEVPGVEKENIDLSVKDDYLTVSVDGKRRYRKTINLPAKALPDEAKASYNNGVLEVELQKMTEEAGEPIEIE